MASRTGDRRARAGRVAAAPDRDRPAVHSGPKGVRRTAKPRHAQPRGAHSPASPYVMTTLTVPGAVPEGLPGTGSPRPQGPGRGKGPKGPPRGNGANGPNRGNTPAGPGGGPGKKRGRGNRHRRGPNAGAAPGNGEPRAVQPAEIDDDIGNRQPGAPRHEAPREPRHEPPRAVVPANVDDDIGNRKPRERDATPSPGNEVPRAVRPVKIDDDFGNR